MKPTIEYDPFEKSFNALFAIADKARNTMLRCARFNAQMLHADHRLEQQAEEEAGCMLVLLHRATSYDEGLMIIGDYVSLRPLDSRVPMD